MENHIATRKPSEVPPMDHSKMTADNMQHGSTASMGMPGHDHHKMMITDFRKRFLVVLFLTLPITLLSTMIQ